MYSVDIYEIYVHIHKYIHIYIYMYPPAPCGPPGCGGMSPNLQYAVHVVLAVLYSCSLVACGRSSCSLQPGRPGDECFPLTWACPLDRRIWGPRRMFSLTWACPLDLGTPIGPQNMPPKQSSLQCHPLSHQTGKQVGGPAAGAKPSVINPGLHVFSTSIQTRSMV